MKNREETGRQTSIDGFAHEHIVAGILMKKYQNVSLVDLPLSAYDIIIAIKTSGEENIIRAQVKTATKSVSFTGGTRGGVDREYKSDIKTYVQNTLTSDIVIGCHPLTDDNYELYFVPAHLIEKWNQQSISLSKIQFLKNNYAMLENCKDQEWVIKQAEENRLL